MRHGSGVARQESSGRIREPENAPQHGPQHGPEHGRALRIPVRRVVLAMVGLTVIIVVCFASYSSALGKPSPHHVPVAVSAPPGVLGALEASPLLSVHPVLTLAGARTMVEDRAAYGALVLPRTGPATLLVANGGGHAVAALLTQLGQQEALATRVRLRTVDIAPTSPDDPNGSVEFYCVIFLQIGGAVGATVLGRVLGPVRGRRDALQRLGLVALYGALLSVVVTFFTDIVYGALVGHFGLLFLILWAFVVAVCLAVTGFLTRVGPLVTAVVILAFVLLGNPSSGGALPRPLLDGFFAALNPLLPQGAALSALRGVQYFGDHGIGAGLLCLVIWAAVGLGLLSAAVLRQARSATTVAP
jgi:hypothetical protein